MSRVFVDAGRVGSMAVASWVGRIGPLEVRFSLFLNTGDLSVYVHKSIVNIGTSKVFDVRYLRTIDPDQEQPWSAAYQSFATNNYVKYQNQSSYGGECACLSAWSPPALHVMTFHCGCPLACAVDGATLQSMI